MKKVLGILLSALFVVVVVAVAMRIPMIAKWLQPAAPAA